MRSKRDWLKAERKKQGYTTFDMARLAGISQSYYSAIEVGVRGNPLNVDIAKKIAAVLGFGWTRFYEDEKAV